MVEIKIDDKVDLQKLVNSPKILILSNRLSCLARFRSELSIIVIKSPSVELVKYGDH